MPRAVITSRKIDLSSDSGAVLWSIVQGEQFEAMLTFKYLSDVESIEFKAALLEAANQVYAELEDFVLPVTLQPGGVQNLLTIRKPTITEWDPDAVCHVSEVFSYVDGKYYMCIAESPGGNLPTDVAFFEQYTNNKIFLQFDELLSLDWSVQPTPQIPTYGFIELSARNVNPVYNQTLKSIRGMVEFVFSPTLQVP